MKHYKMVKVKVSRAGTEVVEEICWRRFQLTFCGGACPKIDLLGSVPFAR